MRLSVCLLLGFLLPASLLAQASQTFRPTLLSAWSAQAAYSADADVDRGDTPVGTARVASFGFSLSGRRSIGSSTNFVYGLAHATHEISATTPFLPDRLTELSLNLGLQRRLSPDWNLAVYGRPGLYGDFEKISADSFNLPILALAQFTANPDLTWSAGLNLNGFSDNPVLPVLGVRWQFAPDWTFELGFPRAGFTRRLPQDLLLRAGVSVAGGNYRITRNLGVPAPGINRLANTLLDYREIRAGVGAEYKFAGTLMLAADVGAVTDRKFDYFDRRYRLDSDAGFFAALSVSGSF